MFVDAVSALVRGLSFVALFQAAGVAIFIAIFGRRLVVTARRVRSLGFVSAIAAIVLVAAHYALEAARMAGTLSGVLDFSLQQMVFESSMSTAWMWRTIGLVLIAGTIRRHDKLATVISLIGAGAIVVAFLFVGHSAIHEDRSWLWPLLALHLAVVAFWFGSLLPLYAVSRTERATLAAEIVDHFSRIAIWLVPAIFLAGLVMAILLIDRWATFREGYGLLLLVKIGGFSALMLLAALNKWRYGPALAEANGATAAFQRTVGVEYVLICAVLMATAFMTTLFSPE
jgi:putative copper resistance protein D